MEQKPTQSLTDHNREYWSEKATTAFEQEWVKVLGKQITRVIQDFAPLLLPSKDSRTEPIRILDFACGNGVASWALASHAEVIRGLDIAPGMVSEYNKRAAAANMAPEKMLAHEGDLLNPSLAILTTDLYDFDLAIVCMALHHMPDAEATLSALVSRLRPGGMVAVIDWAPTKDDKMPWGGVGKHEANHTVHVESREMLAWESVLPMLGRAGCDLSTAYYTVMGEKSHMPEDVTKIPGGLHVNGFLAFAKKRVERS